MLHFRNTKPEVELKNSFLINRMKIYRYIPFKYLRESLVTNKLYFNKVNKWEDPYENFFLKQNIVDFSGKPINIAESYPCYYGECWTTLEESDAMWRIYSVKQKELSHYSKSLDDVAFKIEVDSEIMRKEINQSICELGYVIYDKEIKYTEQDEIDYATQNAENLNLRDIIRISLFVKRKTFSHEQEYRIIIEIPSIYKESREESLFIPFNMSHINEFVADPRLPQDQFEQIKRELLKLGVKGDKIKKSKIYEQIKKQMIIVDKDGYIIKKDN